MKKQPTKIPAGKRGNPVTRKSELESIGKAPTGIEGFDDITMGGLPKGRTALVSGSPGAGKTLFGMEFLVRGAIQFGEPGVFFAFEESPEELAKNVASLGFDLNDLVKRELIYVEYVHIDPSEIAEAGEYDLEGLFLRLQAAIESIRARRIVIDTLEAIFSGFSNTALLRSELHRLFRWLKDRQLTAIITGERGESTLTRQGLEEYVSDCVILLDQRIIDQISTRRLRVVKYRGSSHGTNEYPFLIGDNGFIVLPASSLGLNHEVSRERIPSGVPALDDMLGGGGFFRGSSILISGTAGTGKSSLAAYFAYAVCSRGERCIFFSSEESAPQILRNMSSLGLDLEPWVRKGLLFFQAARPTQLGLEAHLVRVHKLITDINPSAVIIDPITNFDLAGTDLEVRLLLVRLIDFLKNRTITTLMTSLTVGGDHLERTNVAISSLIDTWMVVRDMESNGERNRVIHVIKSRGMGHSNQLREFHITSEGIRLVPAYLGAGRVLTGSARLAQEAKERAEFALRQQAVELKRLQLENRRAALESQIEALRLQFEAEAKEMENRMEQELLQLQQLDADRAQMALSRHSAMTSKAAETNYSNPSNGRIHRNGRNRKAGV